MIQLLRLFHRLIIRPLLRDPLRALLALFTVALGVAVVIAIELAGNAAAGSFHSSLEALAGKGAYAIRATGGLDERLLAHLARLPYAFDFAPRIEDFASIDGKGEALPFIGLDLIAHAPELGSRKDFGNVQDLFSGDPVWVGKDLGLQPGRFVNLQINDRIRTFHVAGLLHSSQFGDDRAIVADIGLAQLVTGKTGRLDSIEVHLPFGRNPVYWTSLLRKALPRSAFLEPEGERTTESRKMLAAFRWNLRILSYIALIVGAFLIYNSIAVSVVRRRSDIGIVRALGATRGMIAAAFLGESLLLGILGSLAGIALGRLLASAAMDFIGSTVESLYVSSRPAPVQLTAPDAIAGLVLGTAVTVLAALAPAWEAAAVTPVEAMARGREEYSISVRSSRFALLALLFAAAAAVCCSAPPVDGRPLFAYAGSLFLVAAMAASMPAVIAGITARLRPAGKIFGVETLLALQSVRASLARSSVLAAALATAVAMTTSVGMMIGSFRQTVWLWMNDNFTADFYLRPAGSAAADRHPTMSAALAARIAAIPGIAAVDRYREYEIDYDGLSATLASGESAVALHYMSTRFLPGENRERILRALPAGDYAIVSEPFANKHHLQAGSVIRLNLGGVRRPFRILGVFYDYSTERGLIILDRSILLKYLPDSRISSLAVYLSPHADQGRMRKLIDDAVSGRAILVTDNRHLRNAAIQVFDRTFRITYALEAVAIVVAVTGIAGALVAMAINRRREFAVLRFLGGERRQIGRIVISEAGLLGLLATGIGLFIGILLSLILIFLVNKQSFGWTIQFHWPGAALAAALSIIFFATVLAGIYPARLAMRLQPIEAVHEE
jgi:putative ABC transport system permease protein